MKQLALERASNECLGMHILCTTDHQPITTREMDISKGHDLVNAAQTLPSEVKVGKKVLSTSSKQALWRKISSTPHGVHRGW